MWPPSVILTDERSLQSDGQVSGGGAGAGRAGRDHYWSATTRGPRQLLLSNIGSVPAVTGTTEQ